MSGKSSIKWISLVAFLDLFAVSLAIPLFGAYLRSMGITHLVSGLMMSLYSGLQLLSGPVVGSWSDVRGRKTTLLLTLPICTVCYVLLGLASSVTLIFVSRIGLGLLKHTQTLCRALVSDLVPESHQTEASGTVSAISGTGFIIGPIIGGHLVEYDNGFTYVCYLVALIFAFNAGIVYFLIPDQRKERQDGGNQNHVAKNQMMSAVRNLSSIDWPRYWDIFLLTFLLAFVMSIFFSEYSITIQDKFQLSPKWVGYTISFQGLVGSASGFSIKYFDKLYSNTKNRDLQIFHGFLVLSVSLVGISSATNLTVFICCMIPMCICSSLLRIIKTETVLKRTHVSKKGTVIGTLGSLSSVARLVAPICSGLTRDFYGSAGISMLSVAGAVLGASISGIIFRYPKKMIKKQ